MITKFLSKITLLTKNSKILLLGTLNDELNRSVDKYFTTKEYIEINANSSEILNENLYSQYDVIIFSLNKKSLEIFNNGSDEFPKNAIVIIENEIYHSMEKYINSISSLLILPVEEDIFIEKIYTVLSINETNKLLKTKEKIISKYKNDEEHIILNEFLDKYSGSVMFINDDLNENCNRLKDLEISEELFKEISSNILKINQILKQHNSFSHLFNVFVQLSEFLNCLDLELVSPSCYNAFDFLTTIVEDITIYLDELFVYKIIKDVKIFEDSLENNIQYFENALFSIDNSDDDNLEFF